MQNYSTQDSVPPADFDPWDEWLTGDQHQPEPHRLDPHQFDAPASASCEIEPSADNAIAVPTAAQVSLLLEQLEAVTSCVDVESRDEVDELHEVEKTGESSESRREEDAEPSQVVARSQVEEPWITSDLPLGGHDEESDGYLDAELRQAFSEDADECMSTIEAATLQLETNAENRDALAQISRSLHTLKGASASVGLTELAKRLHNLEETIRQDHEAQRPTSVDHLLDELDWLKGQLAGFSCRSKSSAQEPSLQTHDSLAGASVRHAEEPVTSFNDAGDSESVRVKASQLNRLMDMLAELVMLRNRRETEIHELQEVYHELMGSVSKLRILSTANHQSSSGNESLQIAEVAADVLEIAQRVRDCTRPVDEGNQAVSRFIRQFRQELVELCRAPAAGLFQRLQRAVRDAAKAEGKLVRLETASSVAVDRSLQQRLYEPLLHIVRNAVCHGIESGEGRQRSGKDLTGTIVLEAISGADLLVIEVRDDGGGLNYQAIRQRAIHSGLIGAGQSLSEHELAQLIFHPGFSTRESTDQLAGRGVGMDVVSATLDQLGGWVDVESTASKGTIVRLSIPLPSAIEHLMVFRCGPQYYAIPLLSIRNAGSIDETAQTVLLSEVLGQADVSKSEGLTPRTANLVIDVEPIRCTNPRERHERINLLVDEIVGPEEVVVRPLPSLLREHPFCSGATISSTGRTTLVIDARRLLSHTPIRKSKHDEIPPNDPQPLVLVVDDSISSRKLVVRGLQKYPFRIVEASNGRHALQLLKQNRFAAVFSDFEMPHIDGLELLTEIRSRDELKDTPFTIISSRTDEEFVSRAKQLGVVRTIEKPITDDALAATLATIEALRPATVG